MVVVAVVVVEVVVVLSEKEAREWEKMSVWRREREKKVGRKERGKNQLSLLSLPLSYR